ncbi:hypothetical protein MMC18_003692 [Xylographa bjoerkii]|nr:hypothetical protein [Xylographa bjoerkii]
MSIEKSTGAEEQRHPAQPEGVDGQNGTHENLGQITTYPVFCLTEVSAEYFDEFSKYAYDDGTRWQEITTTDPARIFAKLRGTLGPPDEDYRPSPFLNASVDDIYAFYKERLRPIDDNTERDVFTSFTFLAVDAACLRSSPPQCILCSDAPDYREAAEEVVLKQLRLPLEDAVWHMVPLEQMTMTPSEISTPVCMPLNSYPNVVMMPFDAEQPTLHEYRPATAAEAQANKRRVIDRFPGGLDDERRAVIYRCSKEEAKKVAMMNSQYFAASKRSGYRITFHDNRSRPRDVNYRRISI